MYQETVIVGHVGREPELSYTPSGIAVCNFSVAVSRKWGKGDQRQEATTWFAVTVWREQAEVAAQHITKGMLILVRGTVVAEAYMGQGNKPQAKLKLTASEFKFLSAKGETSPKTNDRISEPEDQAEEEAPQF